MASLSGSGNVEPVMEGSQQISTICLQVEHCTYREFHADSPACYAVVKELWTSRRWARSKGLVVFWSGWQGAVPD